MNLLVSVDVKQHWTMHTHWSQFVLYMSTTSPPSAICVCAHAKTPQYWQPGVVWTHKTTTYTYSVNLRRRNVAAEMAGKLKTATYASRLPLNGCTTSIERGTQKKNIRKICQFMTLEQKIRSPFSSYSQPASTLSKNKNNKNEVSMFVVGCLAGRPVV